MLSSAALFVISTLLGAPEGPAPSGSVTTTVTWKQGEREELVTELATLHRRPKFDDLSQRFPKLAVRLTALALDPSVYWFPRVRAVEVLHEGPSKRAGPVIAQLLDDPKTPPGVRRRLERLRR